VFVSVQFDVLVKSPKLLTALCSGAYRIGFDQNLDILMHTVRIH